MGKSLGNKLKNILLFFPRLIRLSLLFPLVARHLWKVPDLLAASDWKALLETAERLHRSGFITESSWFWLGVAHANLGEWEEAIESFERVNHPLQTTDEEAYRWCWHAYALAKTGRSVDARNILSHAVLESWPSERKLWVEEFLAGTEGGSTSAPAPMVH